MESKKNYECHLITDFPKSYKPEVSPYDQMEFSPFLKNYCQQLSTVMAGLRMCKVIVLGDVMVGKTSLVNRFCRQIFNLNYKATIGVDFEVEKFEILNVPFNMQIWDTAGQERFRCIASAYYRSAHAIVTVFDMNNIKSLRHCSHWISEALTSNIETPLKFLVGTKKDLLPNIDSPAIETEALKLAKLIGAEYWAVSARTGDNVKELFYRIAALSFDKIMVSEMESSETTEKLVLGSDLNNVSGR